MKHKCAVPNCHLQIAAGLLMCLPHWRSVSEPTSRKIYKTLRAYKAAAATAETVNDIEPARKAYYEAVGEAVKEVTG